MVAPDVSLLDEAASDWTSAIEAPWQLDPGVDFSALELDFGQNSIDAVALTKSPHSRVDGQRSSTTEESTLTRNDGVLGEPRLESCYVPPPVVIVEDNDPVTPEQRDVVDLTSTPGFEYDTLGRFNVDTTSCTPLTPPPPLYLLNEIESLQSHWPQLHIEAEMVRHTVYLLGDIDAASCAQRPALSFLPAESSVSQYYPRITPSCCPDSRIDTQQGRLKAGLEAHFATANHWDRALDRLEQWWDEHWCLIEEFPNFIFADDVAELAKLRAARDRLRNELPISWTPYCSNILDEIHFATVKYRLFPLAPTPEYSAIVRYLMDSRLNVDTTDEHYQHPLHWACSFGKASAAKLLFMSSPDFLKRRDDTGRRPLDVAVDRDHLDVAIELLHHACQRYYKLRSPLQLTCKYGNAALVKALLASGECHGLEEAFNTALRYASVGTVKLLLGAGSKLKDLGELLESIQHDTCPDGKEKLLLLCQHGQLVRPQDPIGKSLAHASGAMG
ncbi:uncharacterized protein LTR77_006267 [Saxophila tyrrhenica]|uniref:Uncharacterized protein n=1 Tax=Saxophila tyrrhenica TaxID=1690608 RepID=A0AAV9P7V9_9PEZI|nr:hypothetical protein LTR77_006267 [Saxophila tyrrhenica]